MILLPLIERLLLDGVSASSASDSLRIEARSDAGALQVSLCCEGNRIEGTGASDLLQEVRGRLQALYGARGKLDVEQWDRCGTRVVMEIPHEPADGDHR